ncbi:MAG: hypothetical protein QW578_05735 [Thermoplasmatales archaeon]
MVGEEIEVRCYKCRIILAASANETYRGYPLINWVIQKHMKQEHGKDVPIDKVMREVIILTNNKK